jgi:hypothetical protein
MFSISLFAQPNETDKETDPAQTGASDVPPDFKSDGCTYFPDGNYRDCCVSHDKDYYKGGSWKERRRSDNRLYSCVRNKKGWKNKIIAPMMWVGVRVFGTSWLPTKFRWGFGKKKKARVKFQKVNQAKSEKVTNSSNK